MGRIAGMIVTFAGLALVLLMARRETAIAKAWRVALPEMEVAMDAPVPPAPPTPVLPAEVEPPPPMAVDTSPRPLGIEGTVKFAGVAPKPKKIKAAAFGANLELVDASVLVNANGTLRNVVVQVTKGPRGPAAPVRPVEVRQKGLQFEPRIVVVPLDREVTFANDDEELACIHGRAEKNAEFNVSLRSAKSFARSFPIAEKIKVKSDIYPWMTAWVVVAPTPWFAITDEKGGFVLKDLPAGEYVIEAWHEKYGSQERSLTLKPGGRPELEFTFTP